MPVLFGSIKPIAEKYGNLFVISVSLMNNDEASYNLQWFDHAELTKNWENKYIIHQEISRKTEKLTPLSGWTPC